MRVDLDLSARELLSARGEVSSANAYSGIIAQANRRVTIRDALGKRRYVTLFEARLIELASTHCQRRLLCENFIKAVRLAATELARLKVNRSL